MTYGTGKQIKTLLKMLTFSLGQEIHKQVKSGSTPIGQILGNQISWKTDRILGYIKVS